METFFEEVQHVMNGISYPFYCHNQNGSGKNIIANAHWHYYIEMLYNVKGSTRVFLNGECYHVSRGDMVIINSREVHSVLGDVDDAIHYIVIKLDPQVLYTTSRTIFESKYVMPFTMSKADHQKVFTSAEIKHTFIPELMQNILDEFEKKPYGFELAIRTHLCRIFLWVLRSWREKGLNFDSSYAFKENDMIRLQKVFDYLDANYMYDITVERVAKMFGMSYSYFSRYFKSLIGKTFTQYLNYVRITEAEKLLMTTDKNITEIALDTGFSTSSYFIQQFKHYKNTSPKQFQKKIGRG